MVLICIIGNTCVGPGTQVGARQEQYAVLPSIDMVKRKLMLANNKVLFGFAGTSQAIIDTFSH